VPSTSKIVLASARLRTLLFAMPSGRTHDRITLWSLLPIASTTYLLSQRASVTLFLAGGYLFSGLMFGPDLDTHSSQYRRWGWLRWIWLPYRRAMRHRSLWSHGVVIGTIGRILYLVGLVGLLVLLGLLVWEISLWLSDAPNIVWQTAQQGINFGLVELGRSLQTYPLEWMGALVGLELGSLSHSISDWLVSAVKRRQRSKRVK